MRGSTPDSPFLISLLSKEGIAACKPQLRNAQHNVFTQRESHSSLVSRKGSFSLRVSPPSKYLLGHINTPGGKQVGELRSDLPGPQEKQGSLNSFLKDIRSAFSLGQESFHSKPTGQFKAIQELEQENKQYSRALAKLSSNYAVLLRRKRLEEGVQSHASLISKLPALKEGGEPTWNGDAGDAEEAAGLADKLERISEEVSRMKAQIDELVSERAKTLSPDQIGPQPHPNEHADLELLLQEAKLESKPFVTKMSHSEPLWTAISLGN